MANYGFSQDIYKLAFMSHRERDELMDNINMLPGHREKMFDLFRIIEQLNPKHTLRSTLLNAAKGRDRRKNSMTPSNALNDYSGYVNSRSKNRSVQKNEPHSSQWSNENVGVSLTSLHNLKQPSTSKKLAPALSSYTQNHSSKISNNNSSYSSHNKISAYGVNNLLVLNDGSNIS